MDKSKFDRLAEGLLYQSETDAPLEFYELSDEAARHWPPATAAQFLELIGEARDRPVELLDPEQFFMKLRPGNEDKEDQIEALRKALSEGLDDPRVFRVGGIRIDIYVLGRDARGKICGLQTLSVET